MFNKEFADAITHEGFFTLRAIRPLLINKNPKDITEFKLLEMTNFDDLKLGKSLAAKFAMTFIDLTSAKISGEMLGQIKKDIVIEYRVLPIQKNAKNITLVTFDPNMKKKRDEIRQKVKYPIELILTSLSSFKSLFSNIKESFEDLADSVEEVRADAEVEGDVVIKEDEIGEEVVKFVNKTLAVAFAKKVSDIHLEPYEKIYRVRYRVDGKLVTVETPPKSLMAPITSRIKIMAQLDIAEKRKPQDGRIKLKIGGNPIDYRVSSLPTLFGEKVVLRLLDNSNLELDMTKLGFEQKQLNVFLEGIRKPYGMCLVTGPTGSGKTTTLYSALADLNKPDRNISTAEDPVEFNLEGINQVNVKKEVGLTFAAALKSFLRQDPDIIMVGEIRDLEVGEIAIEAALTGHLVLSTLHTNDAPATITRLLNMGIDGFMIVSSLNVIVAQRLLRKICTSCKILDESVTKDDLIAAGIAPASAEKIKIYKGEGCEVCNNLGFKGRVAIYEVLTNTPRIRDLILNNASADDIKRAAIKDGMKTLRMCALTKLAQGLTTIEEVISNSAKDDL